jgi:5-oxopent-3-ene-1,2,5-tricarboxylate decarboxylase / 2-hydroxyhepta-2,4-diene-1,7-dioate isomerase
MARRETCSVVVPMSMAPYRLSGRVFGALLNHRTAVAALGEAVNQAPYKAAPKAPVLYVKPRNTLAMDGDDVVVPSDASELEIGACLGVVLARATCNVPASRALESVAGYLIVNDVSVPHDSYYRPAIRYKARDRFCPIGPAVTARDDIKDPDALGIRTYVDGQLQHSSSTADLVRSVAQLLSDVTEFMTLAPGDILAVGAAAPAARVRPGQRVRIEIDGLGHLENRFTRGEP